MDTITPTITDHGTGYATITFPWVGGPDTTDARASTLDLLAPTGYRILDVAVDGDDVRVDVLARDRHRIAAIISDAITGE